MMAMAEPKGILVYRLGLIAVLVSFVLTVGGPLADLDRDGFRESQAEWYAFLAFLVLLAAFNLLATGLYRNLVGLYRSISRADPEGDRPLCGTRVFLFGQIGATTMAPFTLFLLIGSTHPMSWDLVSLAVRVLVLSFTALFVVSFFAGLGIMVRDTVLRQTEILDKREAECRRRLDEAGELRTEYMSASPPAESRIHVIKDR
jgi:hypothetical protein